MPRSAPVIATTGPALAASDATPMPPDPAERSTLDRLGIGASLACAVHCMAAPFLLLLLPAAGSVWSHPAVHWVLAVLVLPLALWVVTKGYRRHRKTWTLVAAGAGSACIVAGLILPMVSSEPLITATLPGFNGGATILVADASAVVQDEHATCTDSCCPTITQHADTGTTSLSLPPGGLVTMIGSFLLVFAHLTNLIACRRLNGLSPASHDHASGCGCAVC